ncbi:hypothetical protein UFOVP839_22 [uncultured Caudovirales phage]|uniref:Uncharacterized protein n=1 Tax=uncultured Caudovirales phage TaxID=2100421 RepID=A0A6J5QG05_9CAUD|nr:hypothetical protein UFOVP839_22 [uncultured Caudovirales phage]CAB4183650.1 hypothetical protein UFOVP1100_47 [uncultured Caudovirales phage]CAB4214615.1 hypothetical protein UFOVP1461_50 [uncultured Caudovirales phage]CAB4219343.1 hypothetical protein UFOVP1612_53 [uncultured Caudovirales phage]
MALATVGGGYQYTDGNQNEVKINPQGTPATASVTATLTAAQLATGIITINQAGAAACTLTLPTGALMDAAFTNMQNNASFDVAFINVSTVDAEDATIAVGTGWTLVGNVTVAANSGVTTISSALFRARRTAAATWSLYRLS